MSFSVNLKLKKLDFIDRDPTEPAHVSSYIFVMIVFLSSFFSSFLIRLVSDLS